MLNKSFALLNFSFLLSLNFMGVCAQISNERGVFKKVFTHTAHLIVMLNIDYEDAPEVGAGIVFGYEKDRLLIATADHVVHRGTLLPRNIWIKFRCRPDSLKAKLLKYGLGGLDLAVLSIEDLSKHGINPCSFPFRTLGRDNYSHGDQVIPVGNPDGVPWFVPTRSDLISEVAESQIEFQSSNIKNGHSGGALLDKNGKIVGIITADASLSGRAITIDSMLQQLEKWNYTVLLRQDTVLNVRTDPPLHKAIEREDLGEMKKLLALCHNPNQIGQHFRTPLHFAALHGKADAMSILLKMGAFVDAQDAYGNLPLHLAVELNSLECVKLLIKAGSILNSPTDEGFTPLQIACLKEDVNQEIALFLIRAGSEVDSKSGRNAPIQSAVNRNSIEIVKALISRGAKITDNNSLEFTPLIAAVRKGNLEIIRFLIAAGAGVNAERFFRGEGALHVAAEQSNDIEVVKALLRVGADVNAKDKMGATPLHYAVSRGSYKLPLNSLQELMTALLEKGADPSAKDEFGTTVLSTAKRYFSNDKDAIRVIESLLLKYSNK